VALLADKSGQDVDLLPSMLWSIFYFYCMYETRGVRCLCIQLLLSFISFGGIRMELCYILYYHPNLLVFIANVYANI